MTGFAGQKMPKITDDDKRHALSEQLRITGIAFESTGKQLFLKCAFEKGDISTVMLDPPRTADLFWALKRLLGDLSNSAGSPATLDVDSNMKSIGFWFAPEQ